MKLYFALKHRDGYYVGPIEDLKHAHDLAKKTEHDEDSVVVMERVPKDAYLIAPHNWNIPEGQ